MIGETEKEVAFGRFTIRLPLDSLVGGAKHMNIQIRNNIGLPIYLQIVERIRYLIFVGEIKEGDALPSARALAEQLGINLNTVNRAYRQLQVEGLIESKPGRGARVLKRGAQPADLARMPAALTSGGGVDEMLTVSLERALSSGLTADQIRARIDALLGTIAGGSEPPVLVVVSAGPDWRSRRLAERLAQAIGSSPRVLVRAAGSDTPAGARSRRQIELLVGFQLAGEEGASSDESRIVVPVHLERESVRSLLLVPQGVVPVVVAADREAGQWLADSVSPLLGGGAAPELTVAAHTAALDLRPGAHYVVEAGLPGLDVFMRQYPDRCVVAEMTFGQSAIDRVLAAAS